MSNLLIIGGTGFFGKSILDSYSRGLLGDWGINSVTVIARDVDSLSRAHPYLIGNSVRLLSMDITNCNSLPSADYVIHAAASTNAENYLLRPHEERENVHLATANYAKLAKQYHTNSKIVYASSGAVYGKLADNKNAFCENDPLGMIESLDSSKRDYAAAKRDSEEIIHNLGRAGLNVSIARCFAFVGPYLPRDQHFAIGNFLADGFSQRAIRVKATHPVYRSYLYADDLVRWLMTIANHASVNVPIYNVGSDQALLMGDLALKISKCLGVPVEIPEFTQSAIDRYIPSIAKIKNELGLVVQTGLDEAIEMTVKRINALKMTDT